MTPLRPSFALLAVLLALACREAPKNGDDYSVVAELEGDSVTAEALAQELAFAAKTSGGVLPQTEAELLAFKRATLEELIDRKLLIRAAHQVGIAIPSERVDRELLKLKAEYHGAEFNDALAEGQVSQQELRERTRARMLVERYFADEVFSRVAVTDPEIEAWYAEHAAEFSQPEQVHAAQIVVATVEEARRILGEIRKGMSFDEAARRWSLSPDAKAGGDLGFFARGIMPAAFDQTCFALQPGRVSEVVATEYGFHLFKSIERRPAEQRPLERVRAEVEKRLLQKKREEAQKATIDELRAKARIRVHDEALLRVRM